MKSICFGVCIAAVALMPSASFAQSSAGRSATQSAEAAQPAASLAQSNADKAIQNATPGASNSDPGGPLSRGLAAGDSAAAQLRSNCATANGGVAVNPDSASASASAKVVNCQPGGMAEQGTPPHR